MAKNAIRQTSHFTNLIQRRNTREGQQWKARPYYVSLNLCTHKGRLEADGLTLFDENKTIPFRGVVVFHKLGHAQMIKKNILE